MRRGRSCCDCDWICGQRGRSRAGRIDLEAKRAGCACPRSRCLHGNRNDSSARHIRCLNLRRELRCVHILRSEGGRIPVHRARIPKSCAIHRQRQRGASRARECGREARDRRNQSSCRPTALRKHGLVTVLPPGPGTNLKGSGPAARELGCSQKVYVAAKSHGCIAEVDLSSCHRGCSRFQCRRQRQYVPGVTDVV
jgi:hypothetical protein